MVKQKILVVDDEVNVVKALSDLLIANGYDVVAAGDADTGVSLVKKERPDLILLDIMMPRISGLELLKRIKEGRPGARVPIIVVSAKSDVDTMSEAMWHYADKYITKPYDPGELLNSIRASLEYYSTGFSGT